MALCHKCATQIHICAQQRHNGRTLIVTINLVLWFLCFQTCATTSRHPDCGTEWLHCTSSGDLMAYAYPSHSLLLGRDHEIRLYVNDTLQPAVLTDSGRPRLAISVPYGIHIKGFRVVEGSVECNTTWDDYGPLVYCSETSADGQIRNKSVEFNFEIVDQTRLPDPVTITIARRHSNIPSTEYYPDNITIAMPLAAESHIILFSSVTPTKSDFVPTDMQSNETTETFSHVYHIQKQGPTALAGLRFDAYIPQTVVGSHELEVEIDQPVVTARHTTANCVVQIEEPKLPDKTASQQSPVLSTWRWRFAHDLLEQRLQSVVDAVIRNRQPYVRFTDTTLSRQNVQCATLRCTRVSCNFDRFEDMNVATISFDARLRLLNNESEHRHFDRSTILHQFGTIAVVEPIGFIRPMPNLPTHITATATLTNVSVLFDSESHQRSRMTRTQAAAHWIALILFTFVILLIITAAIWCKFRKKSHSHRTSTSRMTNNINNNGTDVTQTTFEHREQTEYLM